MASVRKLSALRQMSLQCDTPKYQQQQQPQQKKKMMLRKQHSEDLGADEKLSSHQNAEDRQNIRVSFSAKAGRTKTKQGNDPPPVKLAWTENAHQKSFDEQLLFKKDEGGVVAKKCKEIKRPMTAKLMRKQASLDRDSILCSNSHKLAERLRQAWEDREKTRQNLDIFLLPTNPKNDDQQFDAAESTESNVRYSDKEQQPTPKILEPLNRQLHEENSMKSIFQKQMRRNSYRNHRSATVDFPYTPSRTADKVRENTIVVVPIVDANNGKEAETNSCYKPSPNHHRHHQQADEHEHEHEHQSEETRSVKKVEEAAPMNIVIRPSTAACAASTRREMFQKRTNSAFNEVVLQTKTPSTLNARPPLIRASSVPCKGSSANHQQNKIKFPASAKRRTKSGSGAKKRQQSALLVATVDGTNALLSDEDGEGSSPSERASRKKFVQRCIAAASSGSEIETMVSLISPEGSDAEEPAAVAEKDKQKTPSPIKTNLLKKEEPPRTENKNFTLRKTVKSVSFQQSSIHAVRSFQASFPARRGSVASTLMLGHNNNNNNHANNGQRDKSNNGHPASTSSLSDDINDRGPKRRLLRTKSVPLAINPTSSESRLEEIAESKSEENLAINPKKTTIAENSELSISSSKPETSDETESVDNIEQPDFLNEKEKQCWEMFCKMTEKGVNVTFDTILRGMLTPTEYRMRRKPSVVVVQEEPETTINKEINNTA